MSKFKGFIKWTDAALSLKEMFDEIKGALKDHEDEFNTLQNQNMLLLERIDFQRQVIDDLKDRMSRLENRHSLVIDHPELEKTMPNPLSKEGEGE